MRLHCTPRRSLGSPIGFLLAPLLLAVSLLGCRQPPDTVLQPVRRLVDEIQPAVPVVRCVVADESRPSLGCPGRREIFGTTLPFPEGDAVTVYVNLPAALHRGPVVLEPSLLSDEADGWKRTPAVLLEGDHAGAKLTIPMPEIVHRPELRVRVVAQAIPPAPPRHRTRPLEVKPGSVLSVGLALDPVAEEIGAAPVAFTIAAQGKRGERVLLRSVVRPEDARRGWLDRRVDLSELAGERVRFLFTTEVLQEGRNGEAPAKHPFSVPIWGNPQILQPLPRDGQRNLVLISLDTMRADHVASPVEGHRLMPNLEARAAEGASFVQALAPYPSTTASHMSLFTSSYPAVHKVLHAKHVLRKTIPTLGEMLAAKRFETAAFTENGMLAAEAGFERGFDDYYENKGLSMWDTRGDAGVTFERGLRWLRRHRDEKVFLFLHTYQVHTPYEPPPEYDVITIPPRPGEKPQVAAQRGRYAGEVRYTDAVLAGVFREIERLGLARETIVVVTADHGEEFGEHGSVGHSRGVYEEVLRVPLVVWAPGLVPPGRVVEAQASLVDLAPTLLDLLSLPPVPGLQGESLAPLLRGEAAQPSSAVRFAEGPAYKSAEGRIFSARTDRYKWIGREHVAEPTEIYDLEADPGETRNLDDRALREKGRELLSIYRSMDAAGGGSKERKLDPRTQEKLKALGYTE